MAENKLKETEASVDEFIASVENDQRRQDAETLLAMMKRITGNEPKRWGPTIVGFDTYHYRYESGREGDSFMSGFSPRKANLSIYVMPGFEPYKDLLAGLGKHKTGSSCLYINKLADVDMQVLETLIERSYKDMNAKYPKS